MAALKMTLFALGTMAFFAVVYLAIRHPELVENPGESSDTSDSHPLKKWDKAMTWVMWLGWGSAGLLTFLGRAGFLDAFK